METPIAKTNRNIIINSTLIFVIAAIVEMTLHEIGHYTAAISVHAQNVVLYHNYVDYNLNKVSLPNRIFIAGAGPLVSLLIGCLFHLVCYRQTTRGSFFLFNLYMAIWGYIGFSAT